MSLGPAPDPALETSCSARRRLAWPAAEILVPMLLLALGVLSFAGKGVDLDVKHLLAERSPTFDARELQLVFHQGADAEKAAEIFSDCQSVDARILRLFQEADAIRRRQIAEGDVPLRSQHQGLGPFVVRQLDRPEQRLDARKRLLESQFDQIPMNLVQRLPRRRPLLGFAAALSLKGQLQRVVDLLRTDRRRPSQHDRP